MKSQPKSYAPSLANAGVRVSDLPNARRKKIEADIPHAKALKDYPAVLVARLGVSFEFRSKHIGSDVLDFIKLWFIEPLNKTECRFVIVDAYNTPSTMAFYEQNGFKVVFSVEQQEKDYRHITSETSLSTRLMYCDLMKTVKEYR
ncbi:MAG: GNAT family N-acetyltransferase [Alloprevotella sp.]|nr:GNAT family N-acetyltransferase [Alloprevotella sp.]MDY4058550.1 GNAT family N-acetyltransferase [Alloprevotella sp.]MDY4567975.1 GNAT family N-acetyltransferase [Alloprevotella sp.]